MIAARGTQTHTHARTRTNTHTRTHAHAHTHTPHTHGHTRTHTDAHAHTRTHTDTHGHTRTHTDTHGHTHTHTCKDCRQINSPTLHPGASTAYSAFSRILYTVLGSLLFSTLLYYTRLCSTTLHVYTCLVRRTTFQLKAMH